MARLLLQDPKYARALLRMNMNHGRDFDCMSVNCPVCKPYREAEAEEYQAKTPEEQRNMYFGNIGVAK